MKISIGSLVAGLFLLGVGIAIGKYGLTQISEGMASESWVEADAVVTDFGFHKRSRSGPAKKGRSGGGSAPATVFIEYSYEIRGQEYVGNKVGYGALTGGEIPKRVQKGETISIKYDPENVADSAWVTGIAKSAKIASLCGLALVIVGAYFFIKGFINGFRAKRGR